MESEITTPSTVRLLSAYITPSSPSATERRRRKKHRREMSRRHHHQQQQQRVVLLDDEPIEIQPDAPVTPLSIYDLINCATDDDSFVDSSSSSDAAAAAAAAGDTSTSDIPAVKLYLTDPLEVSIHETDGIESLADKMNVSFDEAFEVYLKTGFVEYVKWYAEQLANQVNLSDDIIERALFCVARRINAAAPGLLLPVEVRYHIFKETQGGTIAQFDNTFANRLYQRIAATRRQIDPSISDKKDVPLMDEMRRLAVSYKQVSGGGPSAIQNWYTNLIALSVDEFEYLIAETNSPAKLADASATIWRGTSTLVAVTKTPDNKALDKLVVDMGAILEVEPYAPLPGFHIGVAWLNHSDDANESSKFPGDTILSRRFVLPN